MSGITDTAFLSVTGDDGTATVSGRILSGGTVRGRIDSVIPAGMVDMSILISFPFAYLDTIQILSDKDCILKFNDPAAPVPQINLVGGWPYFWNSGDGYFPNPFTVDITGVFVSTPGPAVHLILKALSQ
jgi:hypothetical protein